MGSNLNKLLKNTSYSLISTFATRGLQFIRSVIIARYLGPANLGLYSIITSLNALTIALADSGNSFSLIKLIGKYKIDNQKTIGDIISSILIYALLTTLLTTFGIILLSGTLSTKVYNEPKLQYYIILSNIFLFIPVSLSIYSSILRSYHKIKESTISGIIASLSGLFLCYFLIKEYGLLGAILSSIITNFFSLLIVYLFTKKLFSMEKIKLYFNVKKAIIKESLETSVPNISQTFVDVLSPLIAKSILVILLDFENLGYYHVASYFTWIVLSVPLAVATSFYPIINELYSQKSSEYSNFIMRAQKLTCYSSFPFALILALMSKLLLTEVYGEEYILATNAAYWTSMSAFAASFTTLLGFIFYVQGTGFKLVKIRIFWLLVYVPFSYFLVKDLGILGFGIGEFVAYIFQSILMIKMIPENVHFDRRKLTVVLFLSALFIYIIYNLWIFTDRSFTFSLFIITGVLLLEYKFLNENERSYLLQKYIRNKKKFA